MIDKLSEWAWNVPSIDEYWDKILKGEHDGGHEDIVAKLPEGHLKEYLKLKIREGVGKPIVIVHHKKNGRAVTCDVRDFEAYMKFIEKYKST